MPKTGRHEAPSEALVEQTYPLIAEWVKSGGWIEIGYTDYSRSFVRVLDEGGMIWEGAEQYATLDEALQAVEQGIAAWFEEHG